ncbi:DUF4365 domain-containing protein [Agrobacterium sp. P15N1-A]|uniref:DUF4365 domain-containing protein n=1 Tax=Agrobacterium sp. P15N1-A TaxID=3342820 RepID=UPI0037D39660
MATYSSQRRGQLGVNQVEKVVLEMGWRWQQLDAANDDGVDGLIFVESGGIPTGQIIYVQVKCHDSRTDTKGRICVSFRKAGLARNYEQWRRVVGAAILVHVSPTPPYATHWVNLLEPGAVKGSQVFVDPKCSFGQSSARRLAILCGNIHRDLLKARVDTETADFDYLKKGTTDLQNNAKAFYRQLRADPPRLGGSGPLVNFSSEGWRHITRQSRARLTQLQSMLVLGGTRRVIEATPETALEVSDEFDGGRLVIARVALTFPFRQTCMVKLILRRRGTVGNYYYSFWSIYESRRGRDVLGRK